MFVHVVKYYLEYFSKRMFSTNSSILLSLNQACKVGCIFALITVEISLSGTMHLIKEIALPLLPAVHRNSKAHTPYTTIDALIPDVFIPQQRVYVLYVLGV